jgi:hypothetical protein
MHKSPFFVVALAASWISPIALAATEQEKIGALVDGLVFFGGLFALAIFALVMRLRDARAGLSLEERQARLKRRLPWVIGAMMGLVAYSVLSF